MLNHLLYEASGKRFVAYCALLVVIAMTAPALIPSSETWGQKEFIMQLLLLPLTFAFIVAGVSQRRPDLRNLVLCACIAFWSGILLRGVLI